MARLDGSKNCWFGGMLWQERGTARNCTLILVAGKLRVEESGDNEERDEIEKLYRSLTSIISAAKLAGVRLTKTESGDPTE